MAVGLCTSCGLETLNQVECLCTRKVTACEACFKSDVPLRCGICRGRDMRVVPVASYPCRDFQEDRLGAAMG